MVKGLDEERSRYVDKLGANGAGEEDPDHAKAGGEVANVSVIGAEPDAFMLSLLFRERTAP